MSQEYDHFLLKQQYNGNAMRLHEAMESVLRGCIAGSEESADLFFLAIALDEVGGDVDQLPSNLQDEYHRFLEKHSGDAERLRVAMRNRLTILTEEHREQVSLFQHALAEVGEHQFDKLKREHPV